MREDIRGMSDHAIIVCTFFLVLGGGEMRGMTRDRLDYTRSLWVCTGITRKDIGNSALKITPV